MESLENIAVELIVPPFVLLRLVDKTSLDYLELRDSIKAHGFLQTLCVRPSYRQPGKYEIIEGLHRFCCALDLELRYVPCIIKPKATDAYLLDCQVEAQAISIETRPSAYAARLKMFFKDDPNLTMDMLSQKIHKRPFWIKQMLKLNNLSEEAKHQLDEEKIPLSSAHILAKLPYRVQDDLIPKAVDYTAADFAKYVRSFLKAFKESLKQGKMLKYLSHIELAKLRPRLRSIQQIKVEINTATDAKQILKVGSNDPLLEVWKKALEWCLRLDPLTEQKAQEKKINQQKRVRFGRAAQKVQQSSENQI
jgi:ParB/RepB/Spo0J family partition protein